MEAILVFRRVGESQGVRNFKTIIKIYLHTVLVSTLLKLQKNR